MSYQNPASTFAHVINFPVAGGLSAAAAMDEIEQIVTDTPLPEGTTLRGVVVNEADEGAFEADVAFDHDLAVVDNAEAAGAHAARLVHEALVAAGRGR